MLESLMRESVTVLRPPTMTNGKRGEPQSYLTNVRITCPVLTTFLRGENIEWSPTDSPYGDYVSFTTQSGLLYGDVIVAGSGRKYTVERVEEYVINSRTVYALFLKAVAI